MNTLEEGVAEVLAFHCRAVLTAYLPLATPVTLAHKPSGGVCWGLAVWTTAITKVKESQYLTGSSVD